jgi:hypothetical protein
VCSSFRSRVASPLPLRCVCLLFFFSSSSSSLPFFVCLCLRVRERCVSPSSLQQQRLLWLPSRSLPFRSFVRSFVFRFVSCRLASSLDFVARLVSSWGRRSCAAGCWLLWACLSCPCARVRGVESGGALLLIIIYYLFIYYSSDSTLMYFCYSIVVPLHFTSLHFSQSVFCASFVQRVCLLSSRLVVSSSCQYKRLYITSTHSVLVFVSMCLPFSVSISDCRVSCCSSSSALRSFIRPCVPRPVPSRSSFACLTLGFGLPSFSSLVGGAGGVASAVALCSCFSVQEGKKRREENA